MKASRWGCGARSISLSCSASSSRLSLAASPWMAGYSITKSPCPIELPTWLMEWHDTQPRPACASGLSICSLTGVSNVPAKIIAWSWHPAHHLDGVVPTVSCMYSIDLRYHWLLNDENR